VTDRSTSHLVLIPSYNPGPRVYETVREALGQWQPVWVVVDGSTDDSAERLTQLAAQEPGLRVIVVPRNRGKGAAVRLGVLEAEAAGFTHVLTMDSDGQHPAGRIRDFIRASQQHPGAMILGRPIFDASAPFVRVQGRKVANWWANLETLWAGIGDSLFGFRVYPIAPLAEVMSGGSSMQRFNFDAGAAVRLCWLGVEPISLPVPVQYFQSDEGGVSHYHYGRDNLLLAGMHLRLFVEFLLRLPSLTARRLRRAPGE
jgi:glycosyltransferase involved in cell wall biosynthesis